MQCDNLQEKYINLDRFYVGNDRFDDVIEKLENQIREMNLKIEKMYDSEDGDETEHNASIDDIAGDLDGEPSQLDAKSRVSLQQRRQSSITALLAPKNDDTKSLKSGKKSLRGSTFNKPIMEVKHIV